MVHVAMMWRHYPPPLPFPSSFCSPHFHSHHALFLGSAASKMEESQQPVRVESNGRNDSVLWRHTSTLPLTRLIASSGHHNHHDNDDDDDSDIGGETNCGYYYYYYYNYYWKPIVVLDLAFLAVAMVVLLSTFKETPSTPLRVWLSGYSLHCVFHVAFLYLHSLIRFSSARDPPLSHAW